MINLSDIEVFNRVIGKDYKFEKITDNLYFAQVPKKDLGVFSSTIKDAGIYLYEYQGYEGSFFEIVYKLTGGHFNTAIIGKVENGKFKKFNLKDFSDEVTVLPREIEKQINDKITKASLKAEPVKEDINDPVKPGILKKRLGKLSCSRVKSAKSKLKDKGTHYAKALQRYLNYHC